MTGDPAPASKTFVPMKEFEYFRLLTPTVRFTELVTSQRPQASVLNARLVYSWLAYRDRLGLGASLRSIRREVGLHHETTRQSLTDLGHYVEQRGNDWYAVEPAANLFHPRKAKSLQHWSDGLAYSVLFLPRKGAVVTYPDTKVRFGLNHALIWSHIVRSLKKAPVVKRFTVGGVSALYGISENTVRSVLADLVWVKLITRIDKGSHSEIQPHVPKGDLLTLFRQKTQQSTGTVVEPVERKPRAYQPRNDDWDTCRQLCHGLMIQVVADELVAMAKEVAETPDDFRAEFKRLRKLYDANKKADGKFGAYIRTAYQNRLSERAALQRRHAEEERIATLMANTDFIALREKRQRAAACDPLHEDFSYSETAVFNRVDLGSNPYVGLDRVVGPLHRHIRGHVDSHHKDLPLQAGIDKVMSDKQKVMRMALAAVNHHYGKSSRATTEEFRVAIDDALVTLAMGKCFGPKATSGQV